LLQLIHGAKWNKIEILTIASRNQTMPGGEGLIVT